MAFDLSTAQPVGAPRGGGGFDLKTAQPVAPDKSVPDSPAPVSPKKELTADEKVQGWFEAGLAMLSGATTGMLGRAGGAAGGIAGSVATGKYGTQEGAREAAQASEEGAARLTYKPQTEAGKAALESIGRLFEDSKLAGVGPAEAVAVAGVSDAVQATRQAVRPAAGHAARVLGQEAKEVGAKVFAKDIPDEPRFAMAGGGAAETDPAAVRRARAESLPVPIKLTKGQAERTFDQQQFEREAAKGKSGEPLRQRYAEQNEKILQNFDAWIDQTGAEAGSLRATGQAVSEAIVNKSNKAKTDIRSAYQKARESGDMQERISAGPLQSYLDEHQAEAINATVLQSVEAKVSRIAGKDGTISINDLEEVRKMVGRLSGKDATNAAFGKDVKNLIDQMTEGKGGELYKQARKLRFDYGKEFEQQGAVNKLLSFKPGTTDRSVAYEDVFSHSIMKGSLDDVQAIAKTLKTAGAEGEQAWKELQGATIQHVRDEITKNVQIDQAGNRVISPARLDRLVTELDKDGKLDFIFGKQGAQQIRDVNGIAQDVFTAPPGSVNTSNTASILAKMLDKVASKTTGVPFVGSAAGYASKEVRAAKDRKAVQKALE